VNPGHLPEEPAQKRSRPVRAPGRTGVFLIKRRRAQLWWFAFFEPLANHRVVLTRDRRTKVNGAKCVREVLGTCYSDVEKMVLVLDTLRVALP
jgi:hypothetical protein